MKNTSEEIAKEYGISDRTVKRAARYAESLDTLGADFKDGVLYISEAKKQIRTQPPDCGVVPQSVEYSGIYS